MDNYQAKYLVEDSQKSFKGIAIFAVIVLIGVIYIIRNPENINRVLEIKPFQFIGLSGLIIAAYLLNAYRLSILLQSFNIQTNPREWFGLYMMSIVGNILFYRGGTAGISWFLKKKYRFPYTHFLTLWGGSTLIILLVTSLVGQLSLIIIWALLDRFYYWLFLLFLGFFWAIFLLAFLLPYNTSLGKNRFLNLLAGVLSSWNNIRQDKKLILTIAFIDLFSIMLFSLRLYYCYVFINSSIYFWYCSLMSVFIQISALASLTPGDLGIRELIVGLTSQVLGTGFNVGLLAAALDRTVGLFWAFLLGGVSAKLLLKNLNRDPSPVYPSNTLS
jgi:uncharacterized membrane protein YbhN (UPF0104 family)